jgi:hypothetical protein
VRPAAVEVLGLQARDVSSAVREVCYSVSSSAGNDVVVVRAVFGGPNISHPESLSAACVSDACAGPSPTQSKLERIGMLPDPLVVWDCMQ